ncbi:MAG: hypothetical protein R3D29_10160 [Nitratireductor sp.]
MTKEPVPAREPSLFTRVMSLIPIPSSRAFDPHVIHFHGAGEGGLFRA